MHILLLSAYDAVSHRYWRKGLIRHLPEHEWTVLTLPPRFFSWRMRGNSLSWAFGERETLARDYDLVIATSMTDLSALRGFIPSLATTPTLVYFHENQFDYPASGREFESVEPLILNLYTALAADRILFNSEYNRGTLLEGVKGVLRMMPDHVPEGIVERLINHSEVLPVPLFEDAFCESNPDPHDFHIVWNHRWEYDKGPELLLKAMRLLRQRTDRFTLHVIGQRFRGAPSVFGELRRDLKDCLGNWGYLESRDRYRDLLKRADVVLSTALHDFQGIAVLEGAAAGAIPVVPDRLAYCELFAPEYRYAVEDEAAALADRLLHLIDLKAEGRLPAPPDLRGIGWGRLASAYRDVIGRLVC